jgi:hypothetical protein
MEWKTMADGRRVHRRTVRENASSEGYFSNEYPGSNRFADLSPEYVDISHQ